MAKNGKRPEPAQDDEIYREVKREFLDSDSMASAAPLPASEGRGTSSSCSCSAPEPADDEDSPSAKGRISKEIRIALRILRDQDPASTLYDAAVRTVSQHVVATGVAKANTVAVSHVLDVIDQELSRRSTPRDRLESAMDLIRDGLRRSLAQSIAPLVTNEEQLQSTIEAMQSSMSQSTTLQCSKTTEVARDVARKRKRSMSAEDRSESNSIDVIAKNKSYQPAELGRDNAQYSSRFKLRQAPRTFEADKFLAIKKLFAIKAAAKKYFVNEEQLFGFHPNSLYHKGTGVGDTAHVLSWSALSTEEKEEWRELLAALHSGHKDAVGGAGRDLIRKHKSTFDSNPAGAPAEGSDSSSFHDSSDSDESTSNESDPQNDHSSQLEHSAAKDVTTTWSGPHNDPVSQNTTSAYVPNADEATQLDGFPRNIPWSQEEKRVLLKGIYHGWSNEKIAALLPSQRRRTPQAVSCAKSDMKRRHLHGVPPIRADTPFPIPDPSTMSRTPTTIPHQRTEPAQTSVHGPIALELSNNPHPSVTSSPCGPTRLNSDSKVSVFPTFVFYQSRPLVAAGTTGLEYLLLPIDTPECPIGDASPEEVSETCSQAFAHHPAFLKAHKLGPHLWVAVFKRSGALSFPKRRFTLATTIFRGYHFQARHLSVKPPRTFVADLSSEPAMVTANVVLAIREAFASGPALPQLAQQTLPLPGQHQKRKILAQFFETPGLIQFYIPVRVGASRRCVHVRFEPLDLSAPCWMSGMKHLEGWCGKAKSLSYPN